jgi:hypothetical protein
VEVWFQDESRFGQQGSLTHVWAKRGSRPACPRQTEYKWVYLFGAVCPATGQSSGYLMPTSDTYCMNLHLAEISRTAGPDVHVALVLDQAGWHGSKGLNIPDNITLVPLPAYSPELNPMELVWLYIKSHYLSNRVYLDHEALYAAGTDGWNRFTQDPITAQSLCNFSWIQSAYSN